MPHHAHSSGPESSAGRVALGSHHTAHRTSLCGGNSVYQVSQPASRPSQQASQSARAVVSPDNTKPCTLSQALSITCRNQSAATDQAHFSLPHCTYCAAPISTGKVFRAGEHNSLPAVLQQHHSLPPPTQLIMIPMRQIKHILELPSPTPP